MSEYLPGIAWLVVLLAVNAFFVGAEFAVISARRSQIEPQAEAGSKAATTTLWAMEHATLMLATSQLGITVCSLLILSVAEPSIHHLLEIPLAITGLSDGAITGIAFALTLALVTFLHVVFGEMVPKNLSFSVPDRAALLLAPPLVVVSKVVKPVIVSLNWLANLVLRAFGVQPKDEATSTYTLEEVATIVEQSTYEGILADTSGTLTKAFEFTTKTVADVQVPLADLVQLPAGSSPGDLQRAVATYGFSRYPLAGYAGEPSGYVHLKDVLDLTGPADVARPIPAERVRPLGAVPARAELEDALAVMRRTGSHVAAAVDDAGTVVGVLFLEDIIEELVGEVDDVTSR